VLQWRPANGEDIPTSNTNEIVVLSSFFQRGFGLPTCEFLRGLLHHYEIELVHLNPNSILQIAVFVQLCETFLSVHLNFSLFKSYFLLKYQPSVDKWKVISSVGLQTCPRSGFLDLSMKTSLKGWHKSWFYCENHEPSLPPFVGRLPEFSGTWSEEPTPTELPIVASLGNQVNNLKNQGLTDVCVAAHWLAHRVMPLKKQVHPRCEYNGVHDPTLETFVIPSPSKILELLQEMFQNISSWAPTEPVCSYHLGVNRDPVRRFSCIFLNFLLFTCFLSNFR
jgi:hypothetical protein